MKSFFLYTLLCVATILGCKAQIFYKIEGNGLERPSYLFGTHHYAPESMLDTLPQVLEALKATECVVGEMDMTDGPMALAAAIQPHVMAPADSTLSKLVTPEKFAEMDSVFASLTNGLRLQMFEPMKPVMVETTLAALVAAQEMPEAGQLDTYFQRVAREDSMKVAGLETPDFQAHVLFDIVPIAQQMESLISTLEEPDELMASAHALTEAYLSRDANALWNLAKDVAEKSEGDFFEVLLNRRNAAWLDKLPGMMQSEPIFIAVGALHLYGDGGLVEGLRDAGYTVTPIL